MPFINTKIKDPDQRDEYMLGFPKGLNLIQDESQVHDKDLTEAKNIELVVDGIIPRRGTAVYGGTSGTKVCGGVGYYKSDGTRQFLRVSGGYLQIKNGASWDNISGGTFTDGLETDLLQVRDHVYTFNGTDNLTKYDGTSITVFTEIDVPESLAVTPTGSAGSTAYSYRVSAYNETGETLACTAVAISNGNATLNSTNYNALSWDAVADAEGYNVYGRNASGLGEMLMESVVTNAYNDKGSDTPSTVFEPPEGDSTGGIMGKYSAYAMGRLFVAGVSGQGSRLFYGGVLNEVDNFSTSEGGFVDVFKNDGGDIKAIAPFQGGLIVGKDNGIYKFSFTSAGLPQITEITRSFGMISHRGLRAVENDLVFPAKKDGRLAFYTLGNQENYTSDVLRTNEISIKVSPKLEEVNLEYADQSAGYYYRNLYMCAVPTTSSTVNDRVWVLDARFGSWVYWEGFTPNFFMSFIDTDFSEVFCYGDEESGYMVEMFKSTRGDKGAAIDVRVATKSFSQKKFDIYKIYRNPILWFKDVTGGTVDGEVYIDGTFLRGSFEVTPSLGGAGPGVDLPGILLAGSSSGGTEEASGTSDKPVEVGFTQQGRSIKFYLNSAELNSNWKFLGVKISSLDLPGKRLPPENRVVAT